MELQESNDQAGQSNANPEGFGVDIDAIVKEISAPKQSEQPKKAEAKAPLKKDSLKEVGKDIQLNPDNIMDEINQMMKGKEANENEVEAPGLEDAENPEEVEGEAEEVEEILYQGKAEKLTKDQLRDLAQKGYDYTQKTQILAEEKKAWAAERQKVESELSEAVKSFEQRESQLNDQLSMLEKWNVVTDFMEANNPELFQEVKSLFNQVVRQFDNPMIKRQFDNQANEIKALREQLTEKKSQDIRQSFADDLSKTQKELASLQELGVFIDWDGKVKQAWTNGAENVKSAVYALYGDQIRAAYDAKSKLTQAQRKVLDKKNTTTPIKKATNAGGSDFHKGSWNSITKQAMASLGI